jgi:hypothetical protein
MSIIYIYIWPIVIHSRLASIVKERKKEKEKRKRKG